MDAALLKMKGWVVVHDEHYVRHERLAVASIRCEPMWNNSRGLDHILPSYCVSRIPWSVSCMIGTAVQTSTNHASRIFQLGRLVRKAGTIPSRDWSNSIDCCIMGRFAQRNTNITKHTSRGDTCLLFTALSFRRERFAQKIALMQWVFWFETTRNEKPAW